MRCYIWMVIYVVLFPIPGMSAIIHVPADQPHIQSGIDTAADGDTVLVADGIYTGEGNRDIDFLGKAITVMSENGYEFCIIDCEGSEPENHRGFIFQTNETANSILHGFTIKNGYISGEWPLGRGGGIFCNNASPSIMYCLLTGNEASSGGGIGTDHGDPVVENCHIISNTARDRGAGIFFGFSNPVITDCLASDNQSYYRAGGISFFYSSAVMTGSVITKNDVSWANGGGISCYHHELTMVNCTISENTATGEFGTGGGMFMYDSSATVSNCEFTDNSVSNDGGGIQVQSDSMLGITDSTISNNTAAEEGGGMNIRSDSGATITGCMITDNHAFDGGGLSIYFDSTPLITNSEVSGNTAANLGGGIMCSGSSPTLSQSTISGNTSDLGGGLYFSMSSPIIDDCDIFMNGAQTKGGGINLYYIRNDSRVLMSNTRIYENTSSAVGGGVYVLFSTSVYIWASEITGNFAHNNGGGLHCDLSYCEMTESMISGNQTDGSGGGVWCVNTSDLMISNCVLNENVSSSNGGGIGLSGSSPMISFCTFTENSAGIQGGGLYCCDENSQPVISNSILWNDTPNAIYTEALGVLDVSYSDIHVLSGVYPGPGNINANPLFTSVPYGEFFLSQTASGQPLNSPCVDMGSDLAGNIFFDMHYSRIYMDKLTTRTNQEVDSGMVDMGYHFFPESYITPTPMNTPTPTQTPTHPTPTPC